MADPKNMVTLTIDDKKVTVPEGTSIIEAARRDGIDIPHFCYHPILSIAGSCRLCLVEVEGIPKMVLACDTPVREDMVVRTNTPQVLDARDGMMEFFLINHPLDCPVCDRGGECMLQWYTMDHGPGHTRTVEPRRRFRKPDLDPLVDLERNRCVLCGRCCRFMDEIAGDGCVVMFERGNQSYIGTFEDRPVRSVFSGMIIDYCPVGAWTSKPYRFLARTWELQQVQSTCPYCASGCPVTLWMRAGKVLRTTTPSTPQRVNFHLDYDGNAVICNQGRFGCDFANGDDRLTTPKVKRDGVFVEAAWGEALDEAVRRLREIRKEHGPEAVGMIVSSRATCEEMYLAQRLAREGLGTNNIDWRVGLTDGEAARAHSLAYGYSTGDLDAIDQYDLVLVVNADLSQQAPVAALKVREAARRGQVDLFLLDYHTDEWLAGPAKGAIQYSVEGAERILEGLVRKSAVGLRPHVTQGTEALGDLVAQLHHVKRGLIIFGLDGCSGLFAGRWAWRLDQLANTLGEGWDLLPVSAERNAVGAFMTGCQPDRKPGGWTDSAAEHWGGPWGMAHPSIGGMSAPEMFEAARQGNLKALYVLGTDDFCAHPWLESIEKALDKLELLIVHTAFDSSISERADIVLPGAVFFEKSGTWLDVSGWPAETTAGWRRPEGVQDDVVVLDVLARKLGKDFGYRNVPAVFEDMMTTINPICPIKSGGLCAEGPGDESPIRCTNMPQAKARLQEGKFYSVGPTYLPSCRLTPGIHTRPIDKPRDEAPLEPPEKGLRLVWSRILQGRDALGDRSPTMAPLRDSSWVELNPRDAEQLGLADGDVVEIRADGAAVATGHLRVTARIAPGLVWAPQNWSEFALAARPTSLPEITIEQIESADEVGA